MKRVSSSLSVFAVTVVIGLVMASNPARADCLSEGECADLRSEIRGFRHVVKPIIKELRSLRSQIRDLPEGSPERAALVSDFRANRRKLRQLRREEIRPTVREFRQGCKRC